MMERSEQNAGEARVRAVLVDGLLGRGLVKPGQMTRDDFARMTDRLCQKLAYLSDANLSALEEMAAANPGGKEKDRFPIAQRILDLALQIQPPGDDASPFLRSLMRHALGQRAIREGWAPELLRHARANRGVWPGSFVLTRIKGEAHGAIVRLEGLEARLARGDDLVPEDARWRDARRADLDRCAEIGRMSEGEQ